MIPDALVETGNGISVITLLVIGLILKLLNDSRLRINKYQIVVEKMTTTFNECLSNSDKRLALLEQRDAIFKENTVQLQKDIRGIYKGLNSINSELARIQGKDGR